MQQLPGGYHVRLDSRFLHKLWVRNVLGLCRFNELPALFPGDLLERCCECDVHLLCGRYGSELLWRWRLFFLRPGYLL